MQQLGLKYTDNTPLSAIISNRLVDVQQTFGGVALLGSITRIQKDSTKATTFEKGTNQYWSDIHISNLVHTYGLNKVVEVYNMIYSINLNEKVS